MDFNDTAKRLDIVLTAEALCSEKPFKQVSIGEICDRASISKSSFYRLFHDKYEVALWAVSTVSKRGVDKMGRTLDVVNGVWVTVKGLETLKHLYLESIESRELVTTDELARRSRADTLRETLRDYHGQEIDAELDFMVDWFSVMGREFAKGWLSSPEKPLPLRHAVEVFADCCPPRLRAFLDNPVEPESAEEVGFQQYLFAPLFR